MTNRSGLEPITVSQLNNYVKYMLENDPRLRSVFVTGEISNLKDHYSSGHYYFSLKDGGAVINSVMFASSVRRLRFRPEEGMKVIVRGRVSLYDKTGSYQLYVDDMFPDGIGALAEAFEQLKKKLEAKGLFAPERKKPIPKFPDTIGVITSPTGAVIRDILNVTQRRYPRVKIKLYPVLVQGTEAAAQLVEGINYFNQTDGADVIIIGRGGGSMEDLWPFNDENLAYAIFGSNIPVISAVGHETDFTICDFVSDLRAPTPSAAAELAVPDSLELRARYDHLKNYADEICVSRLVGYQTFYDNTRRTADNLRDAYFTRARFALEKYKSAADSLADKRLSELESSIKQLATAAEQLNPITVLKRGYSVVLKDNKAVSSVKELNSGDNINIRLSDGEINAKVN